MEGTEVIIFQTLFLTGSCFVVFLWLRHNRWKQLDAELSRPIFDKEQLKHNLEDATWYRILEPSLIAGVTAYDVVHHLAMIDDRVLEALDFSSKINLNTFNQLYAYVREHFLAGEAASIAGNVERLQGYVAEQIVASNLAAQGHVVEFAEIPSQAGWDLLVDGHPIQVKCVTDPALIYEHLEKYPDIPVIVNAEMGDYFAENSQVIVDKDLLHSEVAEHVQDTIDGIDGIHSMPFHVPIVTLALSTVREGKRLLEGRTDIFEACGNIFTDVTFVGGGGWLGSKLGVVIGGAVLGPFGAAVVGILGAIAGAAFGRTMANGIRTAPFELAKKQLNEAAHEAVHLVLEAIDKRISLLEGRIISVKRRLKINFLSWLWPSRRYLLFCKIKDRIEEKMKELREKATWVDKMEKAYTDYSQWQNGLYKPGLEVCKWAIEEGRFNYPPLLKALKKVDTCSKKLAEEAWKLGLISSLPSHVKK